MISVQQIDTIKNTWSRIAVNANALGDALYPKLFAKMPELEPLFAQAKTSNSQKLFFFVVIIVSKLDKLDHLHEELRNLATRHIKYRVQASYFAPFGEAFIEAITEILGKYAMPDVIEAWRAFYDMVSEVMIDDMQKSTL
jgi:hemoglobin-like flavoprotein